MSDSPLTSHSTAILFEQLPADVMPQLQDVISTHLPAAQISSRSDNSLVVSISNIDFAVLYVDQPYPQSDLDVILPFNYALPNGEEITSKQSKHIIISVLTPALNQAQAIGQAIKLTHFSAVVSQLADIQGILWMNSGALQNADMFNGTFQAMNRAVEAQNKGEAAGALLPLNFWTPVRLYSPDQGTKTFGAYSNGLKAFIGIELDLLPQQISAQTCAEQLMNLLAYQFQSGAQFKVGDTLDMGGTQLVIQQSDQADKLSISAQ